MRYRIKKETYRSDKGVLREKFVPQFKGFFGWRDCYEDYYDASFRVSFDTRFDAEKYIEECSAYEVMVKEEIL